MIWTPMLFDGESVRAILAGHKTMTRRLMKQALNEVDEPAGAVCRCPAEGTYVAMWGSPRSERHWQLTVDELYPNGGGFRPPYTVGDGLWGREALCKGGKHGVITHAYGEEPARAQASVIRWPWKHSVLPARFMPRWACRLFLEVREVQPPERVQAASVEDIIAEGLSTTLREYDAEVKLRQLWRDRWIGLHGKTSWERNDWVWPIRFALHGRKWAEERGWKT